MSTFSEEAAMVLTPENPVIPDEEYTKRWESVNRLMKQHNLELLFAYSDDRATFGQAYGRYYAKLFTQFEPIVILFIKDAEPILFCGPETIGYAQSSGVIKDVKVIWEFTHQSEDYPYIHIEKLHDVVSQKVSVDSVKNIGFAGKSLMGADMFAAIVGSFPNASLHDVEKPVSMLRANKTQAEIAVIQHAYNIAQIGLNAGINAIAPGVSEKTITAEMDAAMIKAGSEGWGIYTMAYVMKNSKHILNRPSYDTVSKDDTVLLTVAPRYEGYHGAIGRTVIIGDPSSECVKGIEASANAQEACYHALKAGVRGRDVEGIAREIIAKAKLDKYFLYSGIHSVGVIEFEDPIFGPSSEGVIENGMVLSVDIPIFETPTFGSRIEDGYFISEGAARKFNEIPYIIRV